MSDIESSSDKPNPLKRRYDELTGGFDVKSVNVFQSLPRHPTKKYGYRALSSINKIVIHTSDRDWSITELAKFDIEPNHISDTGCPAITYHDVIMKTGVVFHTLPYKEVSWHAGGYNSGSVAVALMYRCTDPETQKDRFHPTTNALKALVSHCGKLCLRFNLTPDRVLGHRELFGTGWFRNKHGSKRLRKTCPGLKINLDVLRKNIAEYMQIYLRLTGLYRGKIDGDFGHNSRKALDALKERKNAL